MRCQGSHHPVPGSYNQGIVRLLLLSDIHANLEALEAVLDAAPDFDRVVNLGDVVGYGASPNQVIGLLKATEPLSVRGNHDRVCAILGPIEGFNPVAKAAAEWTRDQLSHANLDWLAELPMGPVSLPKMAGVEFAHGSPDNEDRYVTGERVAGEVLKLTEAAVIFVGHTHMQGAFTRLPQGVQPAVPEPMRSASRVHRTRLRLRPDSRYLINPGSVGQPRDRDRRAAFALYDTTAHEVRFYRVPYDIAGAQQRILAAGLPQMLAARLAEGR
jgi:diadenosine tetraphosphatase ApaH/serine/threonine PP2A family protein phosphatase